MSKPGLYGIVFDIVDRPREMALISDEPVEEVLVPERSSSTENAVCTVGGVGFPRMNYVAKSVAIARLYNDMDVVWHDAPCEHAIAIAVEVQDSIFDQFRDGWFT